MPSIQIWSESGVRAGLYPVTKDSVYWFIAFDCDGSLPSQSSEDIKASAAALVQGWEHGIEECVQSTPAEQISRSRFFDKWPLPVPTVKSGSFTLCGDSLHPMTPNLGQVRALHAQLLCDGIVSTALRVAQQTILGAGVLLWVSFFKNDDGFMECLFVVRMGCMKEL